MAQYILDVFGERFALAVVAALCLPREAQLLHSVSASTTATRCGSGILDGKFVADRRFIVQDCGRVQFWCLLHGHESHKAGVFAECGSSGNQILALDRGAGTYVQRLDRSKRRSQSSKNTDTRSRFIVSCIDSIHRRKRSLPDSQKEQVVTLGCGRLPGRLLSKQIYRPVAPVEPDALSEHCLKAVQVGPSKVLLCLAHRM